MISLPQVIIDTFDVVEIISISWKSCQCGKKAFRCQLRDGETAYICSEGHKDQTNKYRAGFGN